MKRHQMITALAVTAFGLASSPVAAQNQWEAQVLMLLNEASNMIADGHGLRRSHEPYTGSAAQGETVNIPVSFRAGRRYSILAVCDTDCSDIDLLLLDSAGSEIDSDYEMDDAPVVSVQSARDGTYRVRVIMAACSAADCAFAVGFYSD